MGKKKKKKQTTAPSGLKIERSGGTFTCSWKIPSMKFDKGTNFKYAIKTKTSSKGAKEVVSWSSVKKLGKNKTSQTLKYDPKNYYPFQKKSGNKYIDKPKLYYVEFGAQGLAKDTKKIDYTMSSWAYKVFDIKVPKNPTVTVTRQGAYTTQVVIEPNYTAGGNEWATQIQYKIGIRYKNNGAWENITWGTIYKTDIKKSHTFTINHGDESVKILKSQGALVYIAVKILGPQGDSPGNVDKNTKLNAIKGWYIKYVSYSKPDAPVIQTGKHDNGTQQTSAARVDSGSRFVLNCSVTFKYTSTIGFPVEYIKFEYAFAAPNSDLTPAEEPSWQEAAIGGDNKFIPDGYGVDQWGKVLFIIPSDYPSDKLLYVRAISTNNSRNNPSIPVLCRDTGGAIALASSRLTSPTITSITSPSSNTVTVNITNNCTADSAYIAVVFHPEADAISPTGEKYSSPVIHYFKTRDHAYSQEYTVTVTFDPTYDTSSWEFTLGAYAFIGDAPTVTYNKNGYKTYSVSPKIRSLEYQYVGTKIPIPPKNLKAEHLSDGNVMVTWEWAGKSASEAEIAWSDYENAIISNEQPSTYRIAKRDPSNIIIRNLELGKTWYFWARSLNDENESVWSNSVHLLLSSAPNIPTLNLSSENITMDDTVTASWAYVSTDNAAQKSAVIALCTEVDGKLVPGNPLITIPNATITNKEQQYAVIDPNEFEWESGNSYSLALRVESDLSQTSEWSEIKTINIIDPIYAVIKSTTLLPQPNPSIYSFLNTYNMGDYTLFVSPYDENDDGVISIEEANSKQYEASLYKAKVNISTPEQWNDEHWEIDPNKTLFELTALPLTVVVDASMDNVTYSLSIERSNSYFVDRPDESRYEGYKGEIIYSDNRPKINITYAEVTNPQPDEIETYYEYNNETKGYERTKDYNLRYKFINSVDLSGENVSVDVNLAEPKLFIAAEQGDTIHVTWSSGVITDVKDVTIEKGTSVTSTIDDFQYAYDGNSTFTITNTQASTDWVVANIIAYIDTVITKTYYLPDGGKVGTFEITQDDLYGYFDDSATYYLVHRVDDIYGQYHEIRYEFVVKWDHQATIPKANVFTEEVQLRETSKTISKIQIQTPVLTYYSAVDNPTGNPSTQNYYEYNEVTDTYTASTDQTVVEGKTYYVITGTYVVDEGDSCDIYRISANSIDLIYEHAQFGQTYVDPYPTIGDHGGHRIVYKTVYGDYIVGADNSLALVDFRSDETDDRFETRASIIDFGEDSLEIMLNMTMNNSWAKDFKQTRYLGGSIVGDWNLGVNMTSTISVSVLTNDWNTISDLRRLAEYTGVCHVRTLDGMNYLADIEVSEQIPYEVRYDPSGEETKVSTYSLSITRIDPVELDGMTLADWELSISDTVIQPDTSGDIIIPEEDPGDEYYEPMEDNNEVITS